MVVITKTMRSASTMSITLLQRLNELVASFTLLKQAKMAAVGLVNCLSADKLLYAYFMSSISGIQHSNSCKILLLDCFHHLCIHTWHQCAYITCT